MTSVLAEAESGMLIHCCCFVVNLVQGNISLRLQDAYPERAVAQPVDQRTLFGDSAHSRQKFRVDKVKCASLSGRCFEIPDEIADVLTMTDKNST